MSNKKYVLTETVKELNGVKLFQIKAITDFGGVAKGDLGGWIENDKNLDWFGDAWVSDDALVSGNARVYGNARVSGNAWVSDDARVYGNAWVSGNAWVYGNARVDGNAWVSGNARVYGDTRVSGDARVYGNTRVSGNAWVSDDARVYGDTRVSGDARVYNDARIKSARHVVWFTPVGSENGTLTAYATASGEVEVTRGCFRGNLSEFESAVTETHSNSRFGVEYLALIKYIKLRFGE